MDSVVYPVITGNVIYLSLFDLRDNVYVVGTITSLLSLGLECLFVLSLSVTYVCLCSRLP